MQLKVFVAMWALEAHLQGKRISSPECLDECVSFSKFNYVWFIDIISSYIKYSVILPTCQIQSFPIILKSTLDFSFSFLYLFIFAPIV